MTSEKKKAYSKRYTETHKEQISVQKKQYRQENLEVMNEKRNAIEICICGCEFRHVDQCRHLRSEKHNNMLNIKLMKEQPFNDHFNKVIDYKTIEQMCIIYNMNVEQYMNIYKNS